jgi:hypothetical protein
MSESTKKPVADRRAVGYAPGIRRNITDPEHPAALRRAFGHGEHRLVLRSTFARQTWASVPARAGRLCSTSWIEAIKQTTLRGVEPLLTNSAGI